MMNRMPLGPARLPSAAHSPRLAVRNPCGRHHRGAPLPASVLNDRGRQQVGQAKRLPTTQRVAGW
jgi:hypothetical protein